MLLVASAFSTQFDMSPFCVWNCGVCGTIQTTSADGLPVELLEFEIEGE